MDDWFEHYVRIKTANPFRVTEAEMLAFYAALKRELWPDELLAEPPQKCDPVVYIIWFAHGVPEIITHVNDVFRHVAHEFTFAEHMALMRAAVNEDVIRI
jgi:hypothetical protein